MKIVMTGATGFIGKAALVHLVQKGHEVTAIVRRAGAATDLPCKSVVWDPEQGSDLPAEALRGADAIVHLAGEPIAQARWSQTVKDRILGSRVDGTRKLVQALALLPSAERPRVLLSGSAIGFYGNRADETLSEESAAGTGFLSEVVQAWEQEALAAEALGMRVVRMRTGIVLGIGGGALEKMQPVILGSGRQWMSWIHLADLIGLIEFSLNHSTLSGAVNFTAPAPVTNAEFTREYAQAIGAIATLKAPAFMLQAAMGEMAAVVLGSTRVLPQKAELAGYVFGYRNLGPALHEIYPAPLVSRLSVAQFVPRPIDEVFAFFSEAKNLETITPPWLNFKILKVSSGAMGTGTLIEYKIKVHGLPLKWRTEILDWMPGQSFVDNQLKGPYAMWHHTHRFFAVKGGTLVTDDVNYKLPVGRLGRLFGSALVKSDVRKIFSYRRKKIAELFA